MAKLLATHALAPPVLASALLQIKAQRKVAGLAKCAKAAVRSSHQRMPKVPGVVGYKYICRHAVTSEIRNLSSHPSLSLDPFATA